MNMMRRQYEVFHHEGEKKISVTHVTIRQSLAILVTKFLVLDCFAALVTSLFFTSVYAPSSNNSFPDKLLSFTVLYFVLLGFGKIISTVVIIMQWLENYFEIYPTHISHKSGFLFKREEKYIFSHIGSMKIQQGAFGKFWNFGTLTFYDWNLSVYTSLYMIHSPMKYLHILEMLIPNADIESHTMREHMHVEEVSD